MHAENPTGGVQGVEEGQQGHKHICQKIFHCSKNIQMAAMETPCVYDIHSYHGKKVTQLPF